VSTYGSTTFVSRAEWGHPDPSNPGGYYLGAQRLKYLVEHHTPNQEATSYDHAVRLLHDIYDGHVYSNGWGDIGYTWLIYDRWAFEGRGFGWTGAHAPGANSISIGTAFIMDGRYRAPTARELQTFRDLAAAGIFYGYLLEEHLLTGHRDWVATSCPGEVAYAHLNDYWNKPPAPLPPLSSEDDVPEFNARPGGTFPWKVGSIDYGPWGGAAAYDYLDVLVGDIITVHPTTQAAGEVVCNLLYPSGKQTEAKMTKWGRRVQFVAEEGGFVTLLVSANGANSCRVAVRR
jgi:hypothetical protein